jgi:hypothetical protein
VGRCALRTSASARTQATASTRCDQPFDASCAPALRNMRQRFAGKLAVGPRTRPLIDRIERDYVDKVTAGTGPLTSAFDPKLPLRRPLETLRAFLYMRAARGPGGRGGACSNEESPGSMEPRCRVTPGQSLRGLRDSATERTPPLFGAARSKGCGKSAPRSWRQDRHGKPHRVQDRIGAAYGPGSGSPPGLVA